jgi:cell wall-associated NlpC family hydrolase
LTRKICVLAFALASISTASAQASDPTAHSGGAAFDGAPTAAAKPTVPGKKGKIKNGLAYAPSLAPAAVKRAIWAANKIRHKPYIYGGGHQSFIARGYDCSGTVSYALHGAKFIRTPLDSSSFMDWQLAGRGKWITVYTNPGHAWMKIAGLRLDTSGPGQSGPRWRTVQRSSTGFQARHPLGY